MTSPRLPLYEQLPEIYRIRDGEQRPAGQLHAYLCILDEVIAGVHENIDALYHDFFIDTCNDWVIPYLADLLGVSHLSGDPWTLRADIARTVFHRRRKGTHGAIESLTHSLTGWAAHAVESRTRMAWHQHLNHLRPDNGGAPGIPAVSNNVNTPRGGMANLRSPAQMSFLNGPFDPFAHVADLKPGRVGSPRYNLPNLGIYLWRLKDYQSPVTSPGFISAAAITGAAASEATAMVRAILHPQGDPMTLFNTHRFRADEDPPELSEPDAVPGPMPMARLGSDTPTGNPQAYVTVAPYSVAPGMPGADATGLVLHIPDSFPDTSGWTFRGACLCAWEEGLAPPLQQNEIVIDPDTGRVLFGVAGLAAQAQPLADGLFASVTTGHPGPTGAQPVMRDPSPAVWQEQAVILRPVSGGGSTALENALANLGSITQPVIVEIQDSLTYTLDADAVTGHGTEGPNPVLTPNRSLWIRAASGQRPVIRLVRPLRFRPQTIIGAGDDIARLDVVLEGLYLTWDRTAADFTSADEALIQQVALNSLTLDGTTLDPGGAWQLDPTSPGIRQPMRPGISVANDFGLNTPAERNAFDQVPQLIFNRSVSGAIRADDQYRLALTDSIVDAGAGEGDPAPALGVSAASGDPETGWGPDTTISGMTCFGRMRLLRITGSGGIWLHTVQVHDSQSGCLRFSFLGGTGNRLPPNHGCVFGSGADLHFTDLRFGRPGYAQLGLNSDRRILEQGPQNDAMGAWGYLLNTHKWKNLNIRYHEYMPVGVRPILVPVT